MLHLSLVEVADLIAMATKTLNLQKKKIKKSSLQKP